jgi:hypothetical protein
MTPCESAPHDFIWNVYSGHPDKGTCARAGFAAGEVHAPGGTAVPTSDDPDAVQTEAVAAAALALNQVRSLHPIACC